MRTTLRIRWRLAHAKLAKLTHAIPTVASPAAYPSRGALDVKAIESRAPVNQLIGEGGDVETEDGHGEASIGAIGLRAAPSRYQLERFVSAESVEGLDGI